MPEHRMKFFTPDLYMRYNSPDETISAEADAEWEQAIEGYQRHLHALPLTENVRDLSKQCFHDTLLLDKTTRPTRLFLPASFFGNRYYREEFLPLSVTPHITSLLLQNPENLIQLLYSGIGVEPLNVVHSPEWNFWELAERWLYDEIDIAEDKPRTFIHRILWSNGNVLTISFVDISIVSVPFNQQQASRDSGDSSLARA